MSGRRAFTLIELLVVILVMGVLVSIALPLYFSTVRESRHRVANSNSRSIAQAIQALYVRIGGLAYNHSSITEAAIIAELNGLPINPCTGGTSFATDYQLTLTDSLATVRAMNGSLCEASEIQTISLSK